MMERDEGLEIRGKRNAFVGIARTPELLSSNY